MSAMFSNDISLKSLDLSGFDTSKVESLNSMFYNCYSLIELNLSGWNTEKVKDMSFMFENCYGLNELDLSSFDTHHVEDMVNMFYDCESLTKLTINNFDMSNVHNAYDMLTGSGLTRAFEKEEEKYIDVEVDDDIPFPFENDESGTVNSSYERDNDEQSLRSSNDRAEDYEDDLADFPLPFDFDR